MCACAVYQLGPRSWKPGASLSQTVSETDAEQTCKLSHDILLSEIPMASTDDADQLLQPAGEADRTSSSPLSHASNSNDGPADLPLAEPVAATDDMSSARHSKLTWSASGGIKQSVADDDDFE